MCRFFVAAPRPLRRARQTWTRGILGATSFARWLHPFESAGLGRFGFPRRGLHSASTMKKTGVMIPLEDHVAVALGGVQDRVYNPVRGSGMDRIRRNIMIPSSLDKDLEAMAEALGETRSGLISKALARYLDALDLEIARERARLHEQGKSQALTPAQMRKALGL